MKACLLFLSLSCVSANVFADIRSVHCPLTCPSLSIKNNDVVFNHTYAISNDATTKFADWVAYKVSVLNFGDSPGRDWGNDPLIDDNESLEEDDYKGAYSQLHVDRGHLAPLASFAGNKHWRELNYLSNITPQKSALNQGAWADLEEAVRHAVSFRKPLYVITGTLYGKNEPGLPGADESHQIPSGYFKVVYDLKGNAASFLFDQDLPRAANYCDSLVKNRDMNNAVGFTMPDFVDAKSIVQLVGCDYTTGKLSS
ncbi:DNA/RNA non-specific endonuclease [Alteromonas sp. C1M14]|uniref:DNA/RNA non-specific endonuclease n=1 Tax=Alteromonas sp. C1M14 TaxID=2841567 RepID=UPI001C08F3DC|nr:DNA/RNA non-specific endonuclease [Alteromonas sp. C1M14]MBU2977104.1 DNA/RNA non-specific endonuclease [Alteromonas sp. C1M14]